jgi:hypothetical protein
MEPHLNTFGHPVPPAAGITEFTAHDIDLNDRLVSKRGMPINVSVQGKTHARCDLHVGPGGARYIFCGLSRSVQRLPQLGRAISALVKFAPLA